MQVNFYETGKFIADVKAYSYILTGIDVNIITENTFPKYFCSVKKLGKRPKAIIYGFDGDFTIFKQGWLSELWVISLLKAEK